MEWDGLWVLPNTIIQGFSDSHPELLSGEVLQLFHEISSPLYVIYFIPWEWQSPGIIGPEGNLKQRNFLPGLVTLRFPNQKHQSRGMLRASSKERKFIPEGEICRGKKC